MLLLSRHVDNIQRARKLPHLLSLASNNFEKVAVEKLLMFDTNPILPPDPNGSRFVLFSFHLSRLASILAMEFWRKNPILPLLFAPLAFHAIACERTHLDWVMMLTRDPKNLYVGDFWERKTFASNFKHLPSPSQKWFLTPPESWHAAKTRFETWFRYAALSFYWWLFSIYGDGDAVSETLRKKQKNLLCGDTPKWIRGIVPALADELENGFEVFLNEKGRAKRLTNLKLATWLIEIWPLVLDQNWKYGHIAELATKHSPRAIDRSAIEALCESLDLNLSSKSRKGGRWPKSDKIAQTPTPEQWLAKRLQSIGELQREWLFPLRVLAVLPKNNPG